MSLLEAITPEQKLVASFVHPHENLNYILKYLQNMGAKEMEDLVDQVLFAKSGGGLRYRREGEELLGQLISPCKIVQVIGGKLIYAGTTYIGAFGEGTPSLVSLGNPAIGTRVDIIQGKVRDQSPTVLVTNYDGGQTILTDYSADQGGRILTMEQIRMPINKDSVLCLQPGCKPVVHYPDTTHVLPQIDGNTQKELTQSGQWYLATKSRLGDERDIYIVWEQPEELKDVYQIAFELGALDLRQEQTRCIWAARLRTPTAYFLDTDVKTIDVPVFPGQSTGILFLDEISGLAGAVNSLLAMRISPEHLSTQHFK